MTLTHKDVAEMLKLIEASSLEEVSLDIDGFRLVVRRGCSATATTSGSTLPAASAPASASLPPRPNSADAVRATAEASESLASGHTAVRAPMVGTFYRRPTPSDPPFVETGRRVKRGDPLCLIEVMKLYTTLTAPCDGVVENISAEDGSLVAFDQVLIMLRPG